MGNTQTISKEIIKTTKEGIILIKDWINTQNIDDNQLNDIIELQRVIKEIELDNDYSNDSFEDLRYSLRPLQDYLPLKIKRIFNISTMDQYTMFITSRWFDTIDDHINLILSTKRFQLNMTKFHYNPIPLTLKTRKFFTHLQTLYLYSNEDNLFEKDSRIIDRKRIYLMNYLSIQEINQLEQWTNKRCIDILFDSNKDSWKQYTYFVEFNIHKQSVLNDKIDEKNIWYF